LAIVKTTVKGQIVIPADLRRKYHITKGTRVEVVEKGGKIVIRPLLSDPIKQARGRFKTGKSALKALLSEREKEANR